MQNDKKIVLSCIQPSGMLTLGNYLGALINWEKMQENNDCLFAVADLHAITVRQEPKKLREQIKSTFALLLSIGLDPEKSIIFLQSMVPQHAQLAWLLNCYTQFGELQRMTQFKDKSAKHADNINAGLFTYPTLMAADILLYQADYVPIGADQKQHLELARNIAQRFNGLYSPTFTVPEPYIANVGARVMSLQDPTKKMSKSDENINSFVAILDKPEDIIRKFKRAVTDSESEVRYAEGKDGINNLMTIYSACTGLNYEQIEKEFEGKGYGDFKLKVGESVVEILRPIRENYEKIINEKDYLESLYKSGAQKAEYLAQKTLSKVMRKIGYIN
ncbi:MAG: tryptophan--tRNA ligase [Acutalibacteraceae bacterium]|nr:tryptophan--tRNA ligase [Acutalibacteraceae bacterium]